MVCCRKDIAKLHSLVVHAWEIQKTVCLDAGLDS